MPERCYENIVYYVFYTYTVALAKFVVSTANFSAFTN